MSSPGWYPDPARQPGQFRYWDGATWSAGTTGNPADPPPGHPVVGATRSRTPLVIAAAALLVVLAVVAYVVLRPSPTVDTGAPLPSTGVTAGDDRSPTPTETPSPTPSLSPTPTPEAVPSRVPCPLGDPDFRQDYPSDGRQHGGGLSFPDQRGWQSPVPPGLTWAYDVGGQHRSVQPDWSAVLAVAALSTADGFETPEQAAELVMECTASSALYTGFTERKDLDAEAVTVDGHPGWRIRSEIHVASDATTLPGDVVEVIVVDLDSPESLAMFWGAVPIGDEPLITQLDRVTSGLRVG